MKKINFSTFLNNQNCPYKTFELSVGDPLRSGPLSWTARRSIQDELIWHESQEKDFANKVFDSLEAAPLLLADRLWLVKSIPSSLQSLTGWQWILKSP